MPFTKLTNHKTGKPVYVRLSFVAVVDDGSVTGEGATLRLPGGDTVWVDESVDEVLMLAEKP